MADEFRNILFVNDLALVLPSPPKKGRKSGENVIPREEYLLYFFYEVPLKHQPYLFGLLGENFMFKIDHPPPAAARKSDVTPGGEHNKQSIPAVFHSAPHGDLNAQ